MIRFISKRLLLMASLTLSLSQTVVADDSSSSAANIHFQKSSYASRIIEYMPAPGQFINTEGWGQTKPGQLPEGKDVFLSLGGFGGYVIFGFDQPIMNNPQNPYGVDFQVKGNAFTANIYGAWTEPGAVMVMQDTNGNGIPDDGEWYELAGSEYWLNNSKRNVTITYYNPQYNMRHSTAWSLSDGTKGAQLDNMFHQQPYYPDPYYFGDGKNIRDSIQFTGTMIKSSLDKSAPSYIEFYRCPAFGYTDNHPNSRDLTVPRNPYYYENGQMPTDGFDISWAVDKNGNYVELDHVDFVKVYCAGNENAGWLGEWSTEVLQVGVTTPDPNYVPKDYYLNYAGITQLKVLQGKTCQYEGFLFKNGRPVNEGTKTWRVSNPEIASIDNNGLFTGLKQGTTWVYFSQKEDIPTDSFKVNVVSLIDIIVNTEGTNSTTSTTETSMIVGEKKLVNAESIDNTSKELNNSTANRYQYDSYTFTSSNEAVAAIDNGLITAFAPGTSTITVTSENDPSLSRQLQLTVNNYPTLQIVNNPIKVPYGTPEGSLKATKIFSLAGNATVYMDSVGTKNGTSNASIGENNTLNYRFTKGEYARDTLTFIVEYFHHLDTVSVPIFYGIDGGVMKKQLLVATEGEVKGYDLTGKSFTHRITTTDIQVKQIKTRGAYAYLLSNSGIARYVVCYDVKEAETKLSANRIDIAKNKLYAKGDSKVEELYRVDLLPLRTLDAAPDNTFMEIADEMKSNFTSTMPLVDAILDTADSLYYAAFSDGNTSEVKVYNKNGVFQSTLFTLETPLTAIAMMEAVESNDRPDISEESPHTITMNEQSTDNQTLSYSKNLFIDNENNYDLYARYEKTFLPEPSIDENQDLLFGIIAYPHRVDADTTIHLTLEAIDNMDFGITRDATIKVQPRIYAPTFLQGDTTIVASDTLNIENKKIFGYNGSDYLLEFTSTVAHNTNEAAISAVIDGDSLIIKAVNPLSSEDAQADITIEQTIVWNNQVTKVFNGTFTVTLTAMSFTLSIGDMQWTSFSNPWAIDLSQTPLKAYIVTELNGDAARMKKIETGIIPANTGVLINGEQGEYTLTATTTDETITENLLVGTPNVPFTVGEENYGKVYVLGRSGGKTGMVKAALNQTVEKGKAYLRVDGGNAAAFITLIEGPITRIENIENKDNPDETQPMYNTTGQKVDKSYRGIIIQNRKKHIRK